MANSQPETEVGQAPGDQAIDNRTKPTRRRWIKRIFIAMLLIVLALLVKFVLHLLLPRNFTGDGEPLPLSLAGGDFSVLFFSETDEPRGIVVLGSGDGGWSYWEENVAHHLAGEGFVVVGWDCRKFADSRKYSHEDLVDGFLAAVAAVKERAEIDDPLPIWYGGWSTGAEQSVAAAASPRRPKELVGLLLAAPGTRGRYGITTSDLLGMTPTGPGSFALTDFATQMDGLRIVQFVAGLDPLDDATWLASLHTPHRVINMPRKLHDMGGAGPEFQAKLDEAIEWTLETDDKQPR